MRVDLERPVVDFLILADSAEIVNGKIYMLGGGWSRVIVSNFSEPVEMTIVVGMSFPKETRRGVRYTMHLQLRRENQEEPISEYDHAVDFRAIEVTNEDDPAAALMVVTAGFVLPGPALYSLTARVEDSEPMIVVFRAVDATQGDDSIVPSA